MRKVKIGAIQPAYLGIPEKCDCLSEQYRASVDEILEQYVAPQLEVSLKLLEQAGAKKCDIVTTCEDMAGTSNFGMDVSGRNVFPELLERSGRLVEDKLAGLSRKYGMYIIGCYNQRIDGRNYNVASIFDRSGSVCGQYRKVHLPAYEKWQITEGDAIEVFELDFGKIGICICYDMMFQEFVQVQALKGAEIIFHPTAGYGWYDSIGEATLRTRANDNSVYIATAKNYCFNGAGKSSIMDYWGQVLTDAGFYPNSLVTKEVDLDIPKTQPEWYYPTQTSGIPEMSRRKQLERRPELYGEICREKPERLPAPDKEAQDELVRRIKSGLCHW